MSVASDFYRLMSDNELRGFYKEIQENKTVHPDDDRTRTELEAIKEVAKKKKKEI